MHACHGLQWHADVGPLMHVSCGKLPQAKRCSSVGCEGRVWVHVCIYVCICVDMQQWHCDHHGSAFADMAFA
jgi:hypothetical protein